MLKLQQPRKRLLEIHISTRDYSSYSFRLEDNEKVLKLIENKLRDKYYRLFNDSRAAALAAAKMFRRWEDAFKGHKIYNIVEDFQNQGLSSKRIVFFSFIRENILGWLIIRSMMFVLAILSFLLR